MRSVATLVIAVSMVALLTVVPVGAVFGPGHWSCGAVAFGLVIPPAAATLGLTLWLSGRYRFGALIGLAGGTVGRLLVVLGAAGGLFLAAKARGDAADGLAHPLKFWLWVLFAYLATLVAETALLAGRVTAASRPTTGPGGESGGRVE